MHARRLSLYRTAGTSPQSDTAMFRCGSARSRSLTKCPWRRCGLVWTTMQRVNEARLSPEYGGLLQERRGLEESQESTLLDLCKTLCPMQRRSGAHAHIEQPMQTSSWTTRALRDLPGYSAKIDQCAFGLVAKNRNGEVPGYVRKPNIFTTKREMLCELTVKCRCMQAHAQIEGQDLLRAANYPRWMAVKIVEVMSRSDKDHSYAVEDNDRRLQRYHATSTTAL